MAKAELKTKATKNSVQGFLNTIKDPEQKKDSTELVKIIQGVTKEKPQMWGTAIIGFGNTRLKYASGREMDWMKVGFSPRKQNITLYVLNRSKKQADLLKNLGTYKSGGGCLYIKRLSDVNTEVLKKLVTDYYKNTPTTK